MDTLGNRQHDAEDDPDFWTVKYIVDTFNRRYSVPRSISYDDLLQQGYLVYYSLKKSYDPNGGATFRTYIFKSMRWRLLQYIVENASLIKKTTNNYKNADRVVTSLDLFTSSAYKDDSEGLYNVLGYLDDDTSPVVKDFMNHIREDERITIQMVLEGYSQKEIANYFGSTVQNVSAKIRKLRGKWQYHNDPSSGTYFSTHVSSNGKPVKV